LLQIGEYGGLNNLIWSHQGVRNAVYLFQGSLTNKDIAEKFNLSYKDLSLMIVAKQ
jgi:alanine dehydrogenase